MVMTCVALNCKARSPRTKEEPRVHFYRFPLSDLGRMMAWMNVTQFKTEGFFPTEYSRLCENHFVEKNFYRYPSGVMVLRPNAVPSVFDFGSAKQRRKKVMKNRSDKDSIGTSPDSTVALLDSVTISKARASQASPTNSVTHSQDLAKNESNPSQPNPKAQKDEIKLEPDNVTDPNVSVAAFESSGNGLLSNREVSKGKKYYVI